MTAFQEIYYHELGDVRPGYTGASPFDYPLDHQGHVALKLHLGYNSLLFIHWAHINRDSLSLTSGSQHQDPSAQLL